jgi:membrane protein YqaA with SNARE-associated domain
MGDAMSVMLGELYKALLAPATEEQARKAAEEVAAYENRFTRIEADLLLLKWMVGVLITLCLVMLGLDFQILLRLPR